MFGRLLFMCILMSFGSCSMAEGFGISMDKDYYFKKTNDRTLEIVVTNDSSKLLFANIFIYEGVIDKTTRNIIFDYDKKIVGYDIYPNQTAIPAGQKRKVKLLRALDKKNGSPQSEEYYRIRVIPKSPEEALKANPKLIELLTSADKQSLEDSDKTKGKLKVFIGSGAILVVQESLETNPNNIKLKVNIKGSEVTFIVTNLSMRTAYLSKTKVFAKDKWIPLGDFAIRGGVTKEISISEREFKNHKILNEDLDSLSFISQSGNEVNIKI